MSKKQPGYQIQKDPPEDLSEIKADRQGQGIDLVTGFAMEPVAGTNFTIILAMANNGLDGVAAFLAFSLGGRDAAFLAGQDNLDIAFLDAVTTVPKIHVTFVRFDARQACDLFDHSLQRMPIIRPAMMRHGAYDEVAFTG